MARWYRLSTLWNLRSNFIQHHFFVKKASLTKKSTSKVSKITYRFGFLHPKTLHQFLIFNLAPLTPANIQVYKLILSHMLLSSIKGKYATSRTPVFTNAHVQWISLSSDQSLVGAPLGRHSRLVATVWNLLSQMTPPIRLSATRLFLLLAEDF
jgi:hypothetical protein